MTDLQDNSKWIWSRSWNEEDDKQAGIMLFRKTLQLDITAIQARIQISADTKYKLYINETLVEVGPGRGDHQIWFYDEIPIARYLRQGKNVIAVSVLRYPIDPDKGNHGMFRTAIPGLYVAGQIWGEEGNVYSLETDSTWKCKKERAVTLYREEERFAPLMIHEHAGGDPDTFGWKKTEYNDSDWEPAKPYLNREVPQTLHPDSLYSRTTPFLYRKKRQFVGVMNIKKSDYNEDAWNRFMKGQQELTFPANSETIIELNAGEEMTGYMMTAFSEGKGAEIDFLYAESYVQEDTVGPEHIPIKKDRMDKKQGHLDGYRDYYRVGGMGTKDNPEVYEPYWFRTFRFLGLRIVTKEVPLILKELSYEETGYPLEVTAKVETSDESLGKIWEISERTLRRCMHETYEDCPFYEQLQYIMDARQQILYTYAISADDRLARKCMDDLRRSERHDGLLNACYPNCNTNVIPGFSVYYILMVYDHMMYFGERKLVEQHMPTICRILKYFEEHLTEEGYVDKIGDRLGSSSWSFIDWAAEWNDTNGMPTAGLRGPLTMESLLYLYGLIHATKLAEFTGQRAYGHDLREKEKRLKAVLRQNCMGKNGMLQDGPGVDEYSQQCQVFGVLTGTLSIDEGKNNLLATILDKKSYTQCTVAMSFYLFRALEMTGLYSYTDQYWNVWRTMLALHCTTCVESEAYPRSECHAWGALVLYELPSVTLGVTPAAPGYRKVRIAPVRGYLTQASGCVKTPVGEVRVSWKMEDEKMKVLYEAPDGVEVEVLQ